MKLIVFGPTGGTGRQVVAQALAASHTVTAVARRPEALSFQQGQLQAVQGDVLDLASFQSALAGQEVVVSTLGILTKEPTTFYSASMANILQAMRAAGVRRLLCLSAAAVDPAGWQRLIVKPLLWRQHGEMYIDLLRMEAAIRASDLDWTIVRPPQLLDKPRTGRTRAAINGHLTFGVRIARADLAAYLLARVTDPATYRAIVEVAE